MVVSAAKSGSVDEYSDEDGIGGGRCDLRAVGRIIMHIIDHDGENRAPPPFLELFPRVTKSQPLIAAIRLLLHWCVINTFNQFCQCLVYGLSK